MAELGLGVLREVVRQVIHDHRFTNPLLERARYECDAVQRTGDSIEMHIFCFAGDSPECFLKGGASISGLEIAELSGTVCNLLERRVLDVLAAFEKEVVELREVLEFVVESDLKEPAPAIPKALPYDIYRRAAEREPEWANQMILGTFQSQGRLSVRDIVTTLIDDRTAQIADNITQNNALLRYLRRQVSLDRITDIDVELGALDIRHNDRRMWEHQGQRGQGRGVVGVDMAVADPHPTIIVPDIDPKVCAGRLGGHKFKHGFCDRCEFKQFDAPRYNRARKRNRM